MLLASGMSPVYPCHVNSRDMRTRPIGTGPFKFAEFKPNEYIRVVKNPDYWKPGRPYLDGVEWTIIPNRSTQTLAFIAGKFDMSFPYEVILQSMRDIQNQAPNAICEMTPTPVAMNLLVNRDAAPFNDPDIRRAMHRTVYVALPLGDDVEKALTVDRQLLSGTSSPSRRRRARRRCRSPSSGRSG
jgi:peptide/nickel transport system substrate-binding protein